MIRISLALLLILNVLSDIAFAGNTITYPAANTGSGRGRHLVFLSGDEEYRSEEGLPMLAKILSQRHGFRCTVIFALDRDGTINPNNAESAPGVEALDSADGIVIQLRFRRWPDSAVQHLAEAVARGIPIVGLRTATHSFRFLPETPTHFQNFNHFGREVLGEDWVSHWGGNRRGATLGVIEPGAEKDPILRGVRNAFGDSGAYETHPVPDARILMRAIVLKGMQRDDAPADYLKKRKVDGIEQPVNTPAMAVAWSRLHHNANGTTNRVFCTTMGAATDLADEGLRRMVVNAVLWGFEIEIPKLTDVRFVDAYAPSDYGNNRFRHGLTPADHALGKVLPPGLPLPVP